MARVALWLLSLGTGESDVERLISRHRKIVGLSASNMSSEVLLARLRVVVVVGVVGGSPLRFVLRTSLGLRNVNEVVEGVVTGGHYGCVTWRGAVVVVDYDDDYDDDYDSREGG